MYNSYNCMTVLASSHSCPLAFCLWLFWPSCACFNLGDSNDCDRYSPVFLYSVDIFGCSSIVLTLFMYDVNNYFDYSDLLCFGDNQTVADCDVGPTDVVGNKYV